MTALRRRLDPTTLIRCSDGPRTGRLGGGIVASACTESHGPTSGSPRGETAWRSRAPAAQPPKPAGAKQRAGAALRPIPPIAVGVSNEHDQLRTCVIGGGESLRHFCIPQRGTDAGFEASYGYDGVQPGKYPADMVAEAIEDLDNLAEILRSHGVRVLRPAAPARPREPVRAADGTEVPQAFGPHCPRDHIFAVDDKLIITPGRVGSRHDESAYYEHILEAAKRGGATIIDLRAEAPVGLPGAPYFDAANVVRLGPKVLGYQVSKSGNEAGLELLRGTLPDYRIIALRGFYDDAHIDTTVVPLNEETLLYCRERVSAGKIWGTLGDHYTLIASPPMHPKPVKHNALGSPWIGMNLLMLNRTTAIVEASQKALADKLRRHGFRVIPARLRHDREFGGGCHCVSLDLARG